MRRRFSVIVIFILILNIFLGCIGCNSTTTEPPENNTEHVHEYTKSIKDNEYFAFPATEDNHFAKFYKSCECGEKGNETFNVEVLNFNDTPKDVLLSFYSTEKNGLVYGVNWITDKKPVLPTIKYKKTSNDEYLYITAKIDVFTSKNGRVYSMKAEMPLEANEEYEYCCMDRASNAKTEEIIFTTTDTTKSNFKFVSFSDSQENDKNGIGFNNILKTITKDNDFYLHTGDVCERSGDQDYWFKMINNNIEYLNKIPFMVTTGNHDSTYKSTDYAFVNQFNYNIPKQDTKNGVYYSFIYGNTKFIILNTNVVENVGGISGLANDQLSWLTNELKNNTCKWTIVSMHCPMYGMGQWGAPGVHDNQSQDFRKQLGDLFAEYGVDLVLQGHDHCLTKSKVIKTKNGQPTVQDENFEIIDGIKYSLNPTGTIYITNGTTGNQKKSIYLTEKVLFDYYSNESTQCYAEYEVTEDTILVMVKQYASSSPYYKVLQQWGIKKTK